MKNVKINGKWDILLPDHRADRPEWHTPPYWEEKRIDSLHKHLTNDDVLFYIGAEEGDIAGLCATWVKQIVLFEPNDKVWANTKAIWEANDLTPPFATFPGFASNQTTENATLILSGFPGSAEGEIISDHAFRSLNEPGDIPQIRIDDLVQESVKAGTPVIPTALTMDVEGSEWEVLQGAEKTLRGFHPKIWLSGHPEFIHEQYGKWLYELRKWIKDLGYKEEILDYQHELHLYYE